MLNFSPKCDKLHEKSRILPYINESFFIIKGHPKDKRGMLLIFLRV